MIKSSLVVVALALVACQACLGADEITKERFLKEYQAALPRLKAAYEQVRMSGFWKSEYSLLVNPVPPRLDPRAPDEYFYWRCHGREKIRLDRDDRVRANGKVQIERAIRVWVIDGDQSFGLRRGQADPDNRLQYRPLPRPAQAIFLRFREDVLGAPFRMEYVDVAKMVASDTFRLESASTLESRGRKLFKATYAYRPVGEPLVEASGWFTVDPGHFWVLEEYEIETRYNGPNGPSAIPGNTHGRNEYDYTDKAPKLKRVDWRRVMGNNVSYTSFKTTSWDFEDTPAKEFTMEAYGVKAPAPEVK